MIRRRFSKITMSLFQSGRKHFPTCKVRLKLISISQLTAAISKNAEKVGISVEVEIRRVLWFNADKPRRPLDPVALLTVLTRTSMKL